MDLAWHSLNLAQTFGQSHVSLSEQVHHSMGPCSLMMHRYAVSTEVITIGGKMGQGGKPKGIWVCLVLMLLSVLGQCDIKTSLVCPAIWVFPDIPTESLYCQSLPVCPVLPASSPPQPPLPPLPARTFFRAWHCSCGGCPGRLARRGEKHLGRLGPLFQPFAFDAFSSPSLH